MSVAKEPSLKRVAILGGTMLSRYNTLLGLRGCYSFFGNMWLLTFKNAIRYHPPVHSMQLHSISINRTYSRGTIIEAKHLSLSMWVKEPFIQIKTTL